jgi:hypothetical protein
MKSKLITTIALLSLMACKTMKDKSNVEKNILQNYLESITEDDLKKDLYILASDSMEGRDTGSEGQKKALKYIINQYQKHNIVYPNQTENYRQIVPASFFNKKNRDLNSSENILALIEGTEKPEEVVIISAHYDHIGIIGNSVYNGADDNASGTSALLAIAKAFQKAKIEGHGPKRSILIFHATGEEHGLLGSSYYADHPVYPFSNTVADINIDMIGRRDELHAKNNKYVYVIGADRLSTELHKTVVEVNQTYIKLKLDFRFNALEDPNHFYERSDHYNFAKHGVPSVFFFNGVHDDYHQASDQADKIEFDALRKRTQLAFATAWELANRSQKLVIDSK